MPTFTIHRGNEIHLSVSEPTTLRVRAWRRGRSKVRVRIESPEIVRIGLRLSGARFEQRVREMRDQHGMVLVMRDGEAIEVDSAMAGEVVIKAAPLTAASEVYALMPARASVNLPDMLRRTQGVNSHA